MESLPSRCIIDLLHALIILSLMLAVKGKLLSLGILNELGLYLSHHQGHLTSNHNPKRSKRKDFRACRAGHHRSYSFCVVESLRFCTRFWNSQHVCIACLA